jgi:catechol O-methyltransferase
VNDRVEIVDGDVAHARAAVDAHKLQGSHPFGLLFLDHAKDQYLPDLKHLLAEGLLAPGCVVVADNICFQGESHTEYLNFVRQPVGNGGRFVSSEYHAAHIEYACASSNPLDSGVPLELRDGVEVSQLCDDATSASELA